MGRDDQTDAGRMGASPTQKRDVAMDALDSDAPTLADEDAANGWNPNQKPVGGEPKRRMWPPENS